MGRKDQIIDSLENVVIETKELAASLKQTVIISEKRNSHLETLSATLQREINRLLTEKQPLRQKKLLDEKDRALVVAKAELAKKQAELNSVRAELAAVKRGDGSSGGGDN